VIGMRRTAGATVLLGVLALAGCTTPDPAGPVSPPTPPVSQSPTETAQERQERLDYAAAEKSYRTFRAEYDKVLRTGGAKQATKVMRATAGGPYLKEFSEIVEAYDGLGLRTRGREEIAHVRRIGYAAEEVNLQVCEDSRNVEDLDHRGKSKGRGELRTASLQVRKVGGQWKVWSGNGKKVESCD